MKITFVDYMILLVSDLSTVGWILSVAGFSAAVLSHSPLLSLLCAVVVFTCFDVLGYGHMLHPKVDGVALPLGNIRLGDIEGFEPPRLPAYRVVQWSLFAVLVGVMGLQVGWLPAVSFVIIWWVGGCDLLYYWIGLHTYDNSGYPWMVKWLWVLPAGPILKAQGKLLTTSLLILNVSFGILVVVILWML